MAAARRGAQIGKIVLLIGLVLAARSYGFELLKTQAIIFILVRLFLFWPPFRKRCTDPRFECHQGRAQQAQTLLAGLRA